MGAGIHRLGRGMDEKKERIHKRKITIRCAALQAEGKKMKKWKKERGKGQQEINLLKVEETKMLGKIGPESMEIHTEKSIREEVREGEKGKRREDENKVEKHMTRGRVKVTIQVKRKRQTE